MYASGCHAKEGPKKSTPKMVSKWLEKADTSGEKAITKLELEPGLKRKQVHIDDKY